MDNLIIELVSIDFPWPTVDFRQSPAVKAFRCFSTSNATSYESLTASFIFPLFICNAIGSNVHAK